MDSRIKIINALKTILTITEGCNEHYFARVYNASVLERSQYCFIAKRRPGCVSNKKLWMNLIVK